MKKLAYQWGRLVNIWQQLGMIFGIYNSIGIMTLMYVNVFSKVMPVWIYVILMMGSLGISILFIVAIGIKGYYMFFKRQLNWEDRGIAPLPDN